MVIFTRRTMQYDAASDSMVETVTEITGSAIQVAGDPLVYEKLGLELSAAPTLLFTDSTYPLRAFTPEFVLPGDTVVWNGITYTVRAIPRITAPDGTVVVARIVVAK